MTADRDARFCDPGRSLSSLPSHRHVMRICLIFQIVERCGAFKYIAGPGINFMLPCLDIPTRPISMRLQQIEVACEVKTKDNVFTHMKVR